MTPLARTTISVKVNVYVCLQDMGIQLEPLSLMFASKGYKVEDVIAEVRRMQTGWQHSDYRAWLKHYTTGKRPRSLMEEGKASLGPADGSSDGAVPRELGTGAMLLLLLTLHSLLMH